MAMRILLVTICLANIAFAFGTLPWMPEKVITTWGLDGNPSGFMSPVMSAAVMSITTVFMGAIFLSTPWLVSIAPSGYFNLPNRHYWLNEENRPKTIRRICASVELLGVGTMFFFLLVQWELFRANLTVPPGQPNGTVLCCVTGILLTLIVFEPVRLYLAFRLPKENDTPGTL